MTTPPAGGSHSGRAPARGPGPTPSPGGGLPRGGASLARALALLVAPLPRGARQRLRLRHPEAAERADRLADLAIVPIGVGVVVFSALALSRRVPGDPPWLYPAGAALGLATGIPHALDRRSLRRRLRQAPRPRPPLPPDPPLPASAALDQLLGGDPAAAAASLAPLGADPAADDLRLRALVAAARGDHRQARAFALRAIQADPARPRVLAETGLLLAGRGRFVEAVRLCEQARRMAPGDRDTGLALVEAQRLAGRLRDAAATLDEATGTGRSRRRG